MPLVDAAGSAGHEALRFCVNATVCRNAHGDRLHGELTTALLMTEAL